MLIVKVVLLSVVDIAAWVYVVHEWRRYRATKTIDPSFARGLVVAVAGPIAIVSILVRG